MQDRISRWLMDTATLSAMLDDPDLRVFDCSTRLEPDPGNTYRVVPCVEEWREGHIPGAGFIDIQGQLSKPDPKLRFTFPDPEAFADAMAGLGVSDNSRVVLYSRMHPMWATRVWYLLRAMGFDNVAVLDGGIDKWAAEGRPLSTKADTRPRGRFTARLRPEMIVDRSQVLAAVEGEGSLVLNALSEEQHQGGGVNYGRPGRIAGSGLVSARSMIDPTTRAFRPLPELQAMLDAAGATGDRPVITYCGGGIAATTPTFVMALLGRDNVALYDNSLSEWCSIDDLPMETG